jgi:hypothetical protein
MVNPDDPKYPIGTLFIIDQLPDYKFMLEKIETRTLPMPFGYKAVQLLGGSSSIYQVYVDRGSSYSKGGWSRHKDGYFNSVFNPVEKVDKKYEDLYT